jgi:geranylgeranyl diphosphate synthase, type II
MTEGFFSFIDVHRRRIEESLLENLPISSEAFASNLNEAILYALFPGGKRWRPLLTLLGAQLAGRRAMDAIEAACAMEYLHTSSIILDDLPAMDDASFRRGRSAVHLVFGEGMALLAALSLLNEAYALLARNARRAGACAATGRLIESAAQCIGPNGMIGGQTIDLSMGEGNQETSALKSRNLKTTALMRLTLSAGALACGATDADTEALATFGNLLGDAYQICDDLIDEHGLSDQIGKPARQDSRHCRLSFAVHMGAHEARRLAAETLEAGDRCLRERFGDRLEVDLLRDAAGMILESVSTQTMIVANPPAALSEI